MQSQLSFLESESQPRSTELATCRHINHDVCGCEGLQEVPEVSGLRIFENFLTSEEQADCVRRVDAANDQWRYDLSRRVQHYGWWYDYKTRVITPDMKIGVLPEWLAMLAHKLDEETGLFERVPEQVIVNEYLPGQGIAMHTDHPGFGPTVCTISLLDDWEMEFSRDGKHKLPALLKRGSCVLLTGDTRYKWKHGIAPRKTETLACGRRNRSRRLSLTFRTVLYRERRNR